MLPWSFSEDAAVEKHMMQLQHNKLAAGTKYSGGWRHASRENSPDICSTPGRDGYAQGGCEI
jgi:hypothetical protein